MVAPAPTGAIQNCPLSEWPQEKVSQCQGCGRHKLLHCNELSHVTQTAKAPRSLAVWQPAPRDCPRRPARMQANGDSPRLVPPPVFPPLTPCCNYHPLLNPFTHWLIWRSAAVIPVRATGVMPAPSSKFCPGTVSHQAGGWRP
jgi:hypothetical protein